MEHLDNNNNTNGTTSTTTVDLQSEAEIVEKLEYLLVPSTSSSIENGVESEPQILNSKFNNNSSFVPPVVIDENNNILLSNNEGGNRPTPTTNEQLDDAPIHFLRKNVKIGERNVNILLQPINGPCPLVAITNVLLLRGTLPGFDNKSPSITDQELVQILANFCLNYPHALKQNYEGEVCNVVELLPKMKKGLDVNIKFTNAKGFEYAPELSIFKLLDLILLHGWVVDPQDVETASALGEMTYNQAIEKVVLMDELVDSAKQAAVVTSTDNLEHGEEVVNISQINQPKDLLKLSKEQKQMILRQGILIRNFLNQNSTQLTYLGLAQIHDSLQNNQLAIFFRNNHFSIILKKSDQLFQLCTDEGFLHEPDIVWESLNDISGADTHYFDGKFNVLSATATTLDEIAKKQLEEQQQLAQKQHDADLQLALELQRQEELALRQNSQQQQQPQQQIIHSTSVPQQSQYNPYASSSADIHQGDSYTRPPTIRQHKESSSSIPQRNVKKSNNVYVNQAANLRQLNAERSQRQQQQQQYSPQQPPTQTQLQTQEIPKKNSSSQCTIN